MSFYYHFELSHVCIVSPFWNAAVVLETPIPGQKETQVCVVTLSSAIKPPDFRCGGIAQWQSIRLQIERSPVQIRVPPHFFFSFSQPFCITFFSFAYLFSTTFFVCAMCVFLSTVVYYYVALLVL